MRGVDVTHAAKLHVPFCSRSVSGSKNIAFHRSRAPLLLNPPVTLALMATSSSSSRRRLIKTLLNNAHAIAAPYLLLQNLRSVLRSRNLSRARRGLKPDDQHY